MESPNPPQSPREQTELATAAFFDNRNDIEHQSPVRASFLVDEKMAASFPSPPESSDTPQETKRLSYLSLSRPTPVRKYSREWWKRSWDSAVSHKVWPRVLYVSFGVLLIGFWIGITFYFATDETRWNRGEDQQFEGRRRNARDSNEPNEIQSILISLSGSLKSFDPAARNLHIEWSGLYQDNAASEPVSLANGTYPNWKWPMDIYRDVSTVAFDTSDPTSNSTAPEDQFYWVRVDNSTVPRIATIGVHEWDSFETDISFGQSSETANAATQPSYSYPMDEWKGQIVFVANMISMDPTDSRITQAKQGNYTGAQVFPLAGARLEDNSLNWRFDLKFENPCDVETKTIASFIKNATGYNDELVAQFMKSDRSLSTVTVPCHLAITITATRPPLVKFAAIMAMIVNWCSTIFVFLLTCECLIMRRGFTMSGSDLLGITFTALFALPSVRMLLPGAPEFGILIDLVGIIPNVLIVSICISAIAITKLNRKKHDKDD